MLDDLEVLLLDEQRNDPKLFPPWLIFFRPVDRNRENEDADSVVKNVSRKLTEQTRKIEAAQVGQLNAHRHWQGEAEARRQKDVDKQLAQLRDQQDQLQAELKKLAESVTQALEPCQRSHQQPEPEPEPEYM